MLVLFPRFEPSFLPIINEKLFGKNGVDAMMTGGAVEEVKALLTLGLPADAPVMRAIGVPEISAMLSAETTRDEAVTLGKIATRQYAKRQFTWFRNQSPEQWPRWESEINDSNTNKIEIIFQSL